MKISKYFKSDTNWSIDEEKLKQDIKNEKLVEIILEIAGEDGMDINTYRISRAFRTTNRTSTFTSRKRSNAAFKATKRRRSDSYYKSNRFTKRGI